MIALIIAVAVAYVTVGLLICGFLDISIRIEFISFMAMVLFWPAAIAILAASVIFAAPVRLGKKLGAKYLKIVEEVFDKLVNN